MNDFENYLENEFRRYKNMVTWYEHIANPL